MADQDDDALFTRGLLDAYSEALDEVTGGRDHRPLVTTWLGRAFSAHATGHVRVWTDAPRSDLCLWRHESDSMASTIDFSMPENPPAERLEATWYACAARRFVLDWFASGYLSELPVAADPHGFTVVLVGTPERPDERGETRLDDVRRYLEVLERSHDRERVTAPAAAVTARADGPTLTTREIEVLRMLGDGLLARTIALRLGVSERTVHKHLGNLYAKLDVHDRLLAVRRAESLGLIEPPRAAGVS
ncbi:response regulator transcription factor [Microbacterium sp. 2FI]|uniref:helix-turn-helix transcriptional regulator n=1 Tax=Microbacterium sp. 2FI TaxID=2502193 RepID=UPI0010F4A622|nr:response regulator transcription factor [Microbacterium sp. 2FI]